MASISYRRLFSWVKIFANFLLMLLEKMFVIYYFARSDVENTWRVQNNFSRDCNFARAIYSQNSFKQMTHENNPLYGITVSYIIHHCIRWGSWSIIIKDTKRSSKVGGIRNTSRTKVLCTGGDEVQQSSSNTHMS